MTGRPLEMTGRPLEMTGGALEMTGGPFEMIEWLSNLSLGPGPVIGYISVMHSPAMPVSYFPYSPVTSLNRCTFSSSTFISSSSRWRFTS